MSIDDEDILRPLKNAGDGRCQASGTWVIKGYTRTFKDDDGKEVKEKVRWLDEVKTYVTGDKPWLCQQITASPFDINKRRCSSFT